MQNGIIIRKIRINKGLTQLQISNDIISQSNYSKFELGKIDISTTTFELILRRLEISYEEFIFIKNGYKLNENDRIVHDFFKLPYNDETALRKIQKRAISQNYLKEDVLLQDIISMCSGLSIIHNNGDIDAAREKVQNVWKRLEGRDRWYIVDIKLINVILFTFDIDSAVSIMERAVEALSPYQKYGEYHKLSISLKMNCSLLLMKESYFEIAINYLEEVIHESTQINSYLQLSIAYIRKGVCLINIKKEGIPYIKKGLKILSVFEDKLLYNSLIGEINKYCSIKIGSYT